MPLEPLRQALARPGRPADPDLPSSFAAVAVPLVGRDVSTLGVLLIQRAEHPQDPWSGQMAFPGGREDPVDAHPRATAERETAEEVGLDLPAQAHHLGPLSELRARNRHGLANFRIVPHAYWLADLPPLTPDPTEVAATHLVPLPHLRAPEHRIQFEHPRARRPLPGIRYQGRTIWGLTLRMLEDLLIRLD